VGDNRSRGRGNERGRARFRAETVDNERLLAIVRPNSNSPVRCGETEIGSRKPITARSAPILIAEAPAMRPVIEMIDKVRHLTERVDHGENGTAKPGRAGAAFAFASCCQVDDHQSTWAVSPKTLFESELSVTSKGAFTDAKNRSFAGRFELADESTLFHGRNRKYSLNQQAKLLRVIETGEFERVGSSKTLARECTAYSDDECEPSR